MAGTHAEVNDTVRPVAPFASDNTNPAGGMMSGAADMAKWMIVQLDSGRLSDGTRLWSPRTTVQLWRPVTPMGIGNPPPELAHLRQNFNFYGLGVGVSDYRGKKLLSHTGGLPGYVSKVVMVPELRLGVAVLTSQESGAAFESLVYRLLDHYLGAPPVDSPAVYARLRDPARARYAAAARTQAATRDSTSGPSLPLGAYAGTYTDPWYGDVTIAQENGALVLRFGHTPGLVGDLRHWQHDTFVARWRDREMRADAFVTFALKPDGTIDQFKMQPVSDETDFSFDFQDLVFTPKARAP